jgi:hypothetical protein
MNTRNTPILRPALTDEPGQVVEYLSSPAVSLEPWTGPLRQLTPDEACAKTWTRSELSAYMQAFGAPAPGRFIEVS